MSYSKEEGYLLLLSKRLEQLQSTVVSRVNSQQNSQHRHYIQLQSAEIRKVATIGSPEYRTGRFFSEDEPFEDVIQRFQRGGLEFYMTTPVQKGKQVSTSASPRQSPRTLANMQYIRESSSEEEEVELQEEVEVTTVYFPPRPEGAPEVIIPTGFKYEIPLPPVDVRVREDGDL